MLSVVKHPIHNLPMVLSPAVKGNNNIFFQKVTINDEK